jgi:hypothetical protein
MGKTAFVTVLMVFLQCIALAPVLEAGAPFLKAGRLFYTGEGQKDFNAFLVSAGSDFQPIRYFSLGFEVQYAYKSLDDRSAHFVNGYFNAKAVLGDEFIRPFVGAGLGYQVAARLADHLSDIDYEGAVGYQILGGLLLGKPGGLSLVAEIQYKIPTGDLADMKSIALLGGIRF